MERVYSNFNKNATLLCISKFLERASYYGTRALLVLFLTDQVIGMDRASALAIYAKYTSGVFIAEIIGAVIGDLFLSNKRAALLGTVLQSIGAFLLCFMDEKLIFPALFFLGIGAGFYAPNVLALFGKSFLDKEKWIDAGFSFFYTAINLGAFIGILIIGYFGESNYSLGFFLAGLFSLFSLLFLFLSENEKKLELPNASSDRNKLLLLAFLLASLFWGIHEIASIALVNYEDLILQLENNQWFVQYRHHLNFFPIAFSLLISFGWLFYSYSRRTKLTLGFGLLVCIPLLFIFLPTPIHQTQAIFILMGASLLAIAEIHVVPTIFSLITLNGSRKYLTLLLELVRIPIRLFIYLVGFLF